MKTSYLLPFIILGFLFLSCSENSYNEIHPEWIKIKIANGWFLKAPKEFKANVIQGIDSKIGYIFSKEDSIILDFDSGFNGINEENDCSLKMQYYSVKNAIDSGNYYKDVYDVPKRHKVFIDTINNRIATIILPTKTGKGTLVVNVSDCRTGNNIGIKGQDFSASKEYLVLEILSTLDLEDNIE